MLCHTKKLRFSMIHKVFGQLDTNTYILSDKNDCLIIDPADNANEIISIINQNFPKSKPNILLTHGHFDHIMAVPDLCDYFKDAIILSSEKDLPLFTNPVNNLSAEFSNSKRVSLEKYIKKMKFVNEGEQIKLGDDVFKVIGLAGHTPGSIGIHSIKECCAFVGDTLQRESIGAVTFAFADDDLMMKNIREKLMTLDDKTKIYPGHGLFTTIGHEREENLFVSGNTMDASKRVAKLLSALSMELLEPKVTDYLVHCV